MTWKDLLKSGPDGDSLHGEHFSENLEMIWDRLEKAKTNLKGQDMSEASILDYAMKLIRKWIKEDYRGDE